MYQAQGISIHAPLAGSDEVTHSVGYELYEFQSTLPSRGATFQAGCALFCRNQFQSTLPSRGATPQLPFPFLGPQFQSTLPSRGATMRPIKKSCIVYISIHAPLAGSDMPAYRYTRRGLRFQSTLPSRGATASRAEAMPATSRDFNPRSPRGERLSYNYAKLLGRITISIHAPLAGSDRAAENKPHGHWRISIHAPLAGSDSIRRSSSGMAPYFNPRSPRGERPSRPSKGPM